MSSNSHKFKLVAAATFSNTQKAGFLQSLRNTIALARQAPNINFTFMPGILRQHLTNADIASINQRIANLHNLKLTTVTYQPFGGSKYMPHILRHLLQRATHLIAILKLKLQRPNLLFTRDRSYAMLAFLFQIPSIIEVHELDTSYMSTRASKSIAWLARRKNTIAIICVSDQLKQRLIQLNAPPAKIHVLPNAYEVQPAHQISKAEARAQLELNPPGPLLIYTGHLYQSKGVDTLINAAPLLPNCQIIFVGGTPDDIQRCTQLARELSATNVSFTGFLQSQEVALYQRAADILVVTAVHGTEFQAPIKIFEYAAAQNPIIAADQPEIKALLQNRVSALLYTINDHQHLAQQIKLLLDDPQLTRQIATAAHKRWGHRTCDYRAKEILAIIEPHITDV